MCCLKDSDVPYWRFSDPRSGVFEGSGGGVAVVLSEELWRNVGDPGLGNWQD